MAHAARQGLAPLAYPCSASRYLLCADESPLSGDGILAPCARDRLAIEMQMAPDHLDAVARQPNNALDQIDRVVFRRAEHHDIAAARERREDATGENRRREWQRIAAVAVGEFRHEQRIADEQRRHH